MQIDVFFPEQNRHIRFLLGLYISRKRVEMGYTVENVAEQLAVSVHSYKRIESGRGKVNATVFNKLQNLLAFEASDLNEIRKIASVNFINDLSKAMVSNYPI